MLSVSRRWKGVALGVYVTTVYKHSSDKGQFPIQFLSIVRCVIALVLSSVFIQSSHPELGPPVIVSFFHMKGAGMLVVSLRGVNFGFWSHLGCSGLIAIIFSRQGLV